jgi:hypothetical protein
MVGVQCDGRRTYRRSWLPRCHDHWLIMLTGTAGTWFLLNYAYYRDVQVRLLTAGPTAVKPKAPV